jgi:hypothetical protein
VGTSSRRTEVKEIGSSALLILMAKSEIRGISVEETIENLVCQPAGRRENDFAISIVFGD